MIPLALVAFVVITTVAVGAPARSVVTKAVIIRDVFLGFFS